MATFLRVAPSVALDIAKDPSRVDNDADAEDSVLCRGALAGDRQAWDALFHRHNRRVVLSLVARGVLPDRARDLSQDAWVSLMEKQRAGRLTRLTLPGLAIVQAGFLAADDARRAASAKPHVSLDDDRHDSARAALSGAHDTAVHDSAARIDSRERLACAERVLAACSASAREVFRLAYHEPELSHREVAQRVGLSVQRVRQTLCEVRKKLRASLDDGTDGGLA